MSDYSELKKVALRAQPFDATDYAVASLGSCATEVLDLIAENESLRKDAERYRWLRDDSVDPGTVIDKKVGVFNSEDGGYPIWEYRSGADLDSAIDAAISSPENPS